MSDRVHVEGRGRAGQQAGRVRVHSQGGRQGSDVCGCGAEGCDLNRILDPRESSLQVIHSLGHLDLQVVGGSVCPVNVPITCSASHTPHVTDGYQPLGVLRGGVDGTAWRLPDSLLRYGKLQGSSRRGQVGRRRGDRAMASTHFRCGAVRCGAVLCCAVRCGAVRCRAVLCDAVLCGAVRCCAVRDRRGLAGAAGLALLYQCGGVGSIWKDEAGQ